MLILNFMIAVFILVYAFLMVASTIIYFTAEKEPVQTRGKIIKYFSLSNIGVLIFTIALASSYILGNVILNILK